jgi:uncharacterized protein (DUF1330 family)
VNIAVPMNAAPAYMVIEARITDPARFAAYAAANAPLVAASGGEYLVMRARHEPLEGDWEGWRVVLSRWPNMDTARRYWNSPDYQRVKALREGTGEFRVLLVEGLPEGATP